MVMADCVLLLDLEFEFYFALSGFENFELGIYQLCPIRRLNFYEWKIKA